MEKSKKTLEKKLLQKKQKSDEIEAYEAVEINPNIDPDRPYEPPEVVGPLKELERVTYKSYSKNTADKGIWGKLRRCAISKQGKFIGYHHIQHTGNWEDGSVVNWDAYEDNGWNCMVEIPKIYYRFDHGKNAKGERVVRYYISEEPDEELGFKLHPAFDRPNHKPEKIYVSAFEGYQDKWGEIRSLPYKSPVASTVTLFRKLSAGLKAPGYIQMDYLTMSLIQLLYITEYGATDSQKRLGRGLRNYQTGSSLKYANKSSTSSATKYMSYRGIENIYGNGLTYVDGAIVDKYNLYVCNDYSKYHIEDTSASHYVDYGMLPNEGWTTHMRVYEDHRDYAFIPHKTVLAEGRQGYYNDLFTSGRGYGPLQMSYQGASPGIPGEVHQFGGMFYLTSEFSMDMIDQYYHSRIQFLD